MVQRTYEAPNVQVADNRTIRGGQVAQADTRVNMPIQIGDDSWRSRLLSGLGEDASKALNKMADIEYSNLYLEGAAKAGVIQSEEEIGGNPLTRDWEVAGYRDTMGKLALAEADADFASELPTLREQGPDAIRQYLSDRREKLMPGLAGMSREARAAASGQMVLLDRSATKKWAAEHTKFIIEQKSQAVATQWDVAVRQLNKEQLAVATGQTTPESYEEATRVALGTLVGSVWMDKFPEDVKRELTFQAAQRALADDNVSLYDTLANEKIPDGKGGSSSLLARLDGDQQLRLSNQYREAMQRTNDRRSMFRFQQLANLQSQLDNNVYPGTYQDLEGTLAPMVLNKTISGEKYQSMLNLYLDKQYKNEKNSAAATQYLRGDLQGLYGSGMTLEQGAKAVEATFVKNNVPLGQQLSTWLEAGKNGMPNAFTKAGEILSVSLRQVRSPDGTMLPQHLEVFKTINAAEEAAKQRGEPNTRVRLLEGLSEQDRTFAERIFSYKATGASYDEAIRKAQDTETKEANMTPAMRAAMAQKTNQEVANEIGNIQPKGWWDTVWTHTKAAFGSASAAADLKTAPYSGFNARDNFFGHSPTVDFYTQMTREAVADEVSQVLVTSPMSTAAEAMNVAKANVAARTISTEQGPLVLPRGTNVQAVFGVAPGNQASIGRAIDSLLTTKSKNGRWQLAFVEGRLGGQEFDPDGQRVGQWQEFPAAAVQAKVREQVQDDLRKANEAFGSGKSVKVGDVSLQYSGQNTSGVPQTWMLAFRDNLVQSEGVRRGTYKDTVGIETRGIGVSKRNEFYPKADENGNVSDAEIQRSFIGASNAAANTGATLSRRIGIDNAAGFALMSEMAYHAGTGFALRTDSVGDEFRTFIRAMVGKDAGKAQEAFKGTATYRVSGAERRKHYLNLIEQSLKG